MIKWTQGYFYLHVATYEITKKGKEVTLDFLPTLTHFVPIFPFISMLFSILNHLG